VPVFRLARDRPTTTRRKNLAATSIQTRSIASSDPNLPSAFGFASTINQRTSNRQQMRQPQLAAAVEARKAAPARTLLLQPLIPVFFKTL